MTSSRRPILHTSRSDVSCLIVTLVLGLAPCPAALSAPSLSLTSVPAFNSYDNLSGRAGGVSFADHKVAVFIYVPEAGGWWTKPSFAQPLTPLQSDGTWTCDITTGGADQRATLITAFLVPRVHWASFPLCAGSSAIPSTAYLRSVARATVVRFASRLWDAKASDTPVGPGPNYFSDSSESVWVDALGHLHLKIRQQSDRWVCPEIVCREALGYGRYVFYLGSRADRGVLDPNAVVGLFTWDTAAAAHHYREIDIEFSTWGGSVTTDLQYVVQPWTRSANMRRLNMRPVSTSTHSFDWMPGSIVFRSVEGLHLVPPTPDRLIGQWVYTGGDIPPAGDERTRINLWLLNGMAPSNGQPLEVVVRDFRFYPALWSRTHEYDDAWRSLDWFGVFAELGQGWIWHRDLELLYTTGASRAGIWFWVSGWDWLWSGENTFPLFWRQRDGAWLWYWQGTRQPRWFYNLTAHRWESL